jgi:hypothetical protein
MLFATQLGYCNDMPQAGSELRRVHNSHTRNMQGTHGSVVGSPTKGTMGSGAGTALMVMGIGAIMIGALIVGAGMGAAEVAMVAPIMGAPIIGIPIGIPIGMPIGMPIIGMPIMGGWLPVCHGCRVRIAAKYRLLLPRQGAGWAALHTCMVQACTGAGAPRHALARAPRRGRLFARLARRALRKEGRCTCGRWSAFLAAMQCAPNGHAMHDRTRRSAPCPPVHSHPSTHQHRA